MKRVDCARPAHVWDGQILTVARGGAHRARMEPAKPRFSKSLLWKLAALALLVAAAGIFVLRGVDLRALFDGTMGRISAAGPLVFFTAMALLPAVGAPFLAFTLTVGPAFRSQLGLGGVLAACAASLFVNITLTYWLARCWLRPWLEKLVVRYGYKVPQVARADQFEMTLLLRITPGPPFFLQNYLLGLAKIPYPLYAAVSLTVVMMHTTGLVIFSEALAHGRGKEAVLGVSLFIAVLLVIHIVRRHYAKRNTGTV
jgi:uncharacterized membrane protein YdjX (TVP38/TMEM64 family)